MKSEPTDKRKQRLMKINRCKSSIEGMLLELKIHAECSTIITELNAVFGDLYYLERLARKAS